MPSSMINPIGAPFDFIGMTEAEIAAYLKLDQTTPQVITATDTTITASDEVYFGDVTDSSKLKKDTVQGILDLVPPSASAHTDLTDMPDSAGTNTDHDTRYVTKVQSATPSTPAPFAGMLWLDSSETAVDTTDHAELSNLDYASAGHTGFEPAITAGTSAQVLLGDKSLAASTAVGGMTLVDTASPSAASSLTFSSLSSGERYALKFNLQNNTTAGYITVTMNGDTNTRYKSLKYYASEDSSSGAASGTAGTATAGIEIIGLVTNKLTYSATGTIFFESLQSNANYVHLNSFATEFHGANDRLYGFTTHALYLGVATLSSITITTSAGTMTGTAKLYRLN